MFRHWYSFVQLGQLAHVHPPEMERSVPSRLSLLLVGGSTHAIPHTSMTQLACLPTTIHVPTHFVYYAWQKSVCEIGL